jgi:alginate O-acetyltransferase complex protein AlgI
MFFQSAGFLFLFLPLTLIVAALAPPGRPRIYTLALMSYVFYSGGDPFFVILLLVSSLTDYVVAMRLDAASVQFRRRMWLIVSIAVNLSMLGAFKYGQMIIRNTQPFWAWAGIGEVSPEILDAFILPAGISFYTFQSMAYTIDVYRGKISPTTSIEGFLTFVAYLPQLIAGPIERFSNLYPQIQRFSQGLATPEWSRGLNRLALGISQKLLIADSCGLIADRLAIWDGPFDLATSWLFSLAFGMQIYYDFAGYTNMAIGVSLLFGIRLSENFLSPYRASSIQDFWRRWHVTLSSWFRDYLYIPLGGSRKGSIRTAENLVLTMALCGLWHGAGWNYVAWGFGHGVLLAANHLYRNHLSRFNMPRLLSAMVTFSVVHMLWVVFRLDNPVTVVNVWNGMLGFNGWSSAPALIWDIAFVTTVTVFTWAVPNCSERWPGRSGLLESVLLQGLAIFAIINSPQVHQFIYFRF